ncbi:MAG: hypothetical protein LBJ96_04530, partial [Holosporaceae bacterium]|nr:hypothetical protein [Holosporaceae bacterium]
LGDVASSILAVLFLLKNPSYSYFTQFFLIFLSLIHEGYMIWLDQNILFRALVIFRLESQAEYLRAGVRYIPAKLSIE